MGQPGECLRASGAGLRRDPLMSTERLVRAIKLVAAVLAAIFLLHWCRGFISIDRCLDKGGRWNHDAGACEGTGH